MDPPVSKLRMDRQTNRDASLREVMSSYPTGVTIVAARGGDGEPFGLTVNSFTSLSLDPPLVLVCIGDSSTSHDRLIASEAFSVSLLAGDQGAIAGRFATDPSEGRFDGIDWEAGSLGAPIIAGSLASLECSRFDVLDGGDHSILIGRVEHSAVTERDAAAKCFQVLRCVLRQAVRDRRHRLLATKDRLDLLPRVGIGGVGQVQVDHCGLQAAVAKVLLDDFQ